MRDNSTLLMLEQLFKCLDCMDHYQASLSVIFLLHLVVFYTVLLQHIMHAFSTFQLSRSCNPSDKHSNLTNRDDRRMPKPKHLIQNKHHRPRWQSWNLWFLRCCVNLIRGLGHRYWILLTVFSNLFFSLSGCEAHEAHSTCFQSCPWQQESW